MQGEGEVKGHLVSKQLMWVLSSVSHTPHTWRMQVVSPRCYQGPVPAADLEHSRDLVEKPDPDRQPAFAARECVPLQGHRMDLGA